ncbi:MAG: VCBS repeat-containing protein [Chitinophagia bacterium]|jgi:hypothetical protein
MLRSYFTPSSIKLPIVVPVFFACVLLISCSKPTLFEQVPSSKSGIHFSNVITETDSINVLDFENVYNGGGVGIGDFNNDGLQDIYFSGNLVSNRLYLNKGNFSFADVTSSAGVGGDGKWCRGVSVVDINNDGWQDIYVCATLLKDPAKREHLLYINQGLDKSGNPFFVNEAKAYGLALTTHGTMAAFFDYDNDGDLDVYLANNEIVKNDYPNRFRPVLQDGSHPNTDQLLRNDYNAELHHPVFTNVSKEAGILIEGYAHAVTIADFNRDGWKDIYVSNDYLSSDLLWINNKNGTFTDQLSVYFKHTSANAMGNDVIDINNDGLSDVIALDMNPEDNYRKKMMLNPNSYQTYQNLEYFNYHFQYVRNTLQLNQGPRVLENDTIGAPVFSDISFYAGVAETDWSWTPLVADYDNDGNRDIIITNGFPKDVTDHDFVAFRNTSYAVATKKQLLSQIPEVKIHNYAYKNNGNLQFTNVTENWGLTRPSFSNGAVYADLDNDGDLDMVVNNINDEAGLYKNTLIDKKKEGNNYLQIKLQGDSLNVQGLGTWIDAYLPGGKRISLEYTPYRGYLSSVDPIAHIGLGNINQIDSLLITWQNGTQQKLMNVQSNQRLRISKLDAKQLAQAPKTGLASDAIFRNVTKQAGLAYVQQEKDFIDFNIQKLIPHKFSEYGPALAVGDVNGDQLEDMVLGGSFSNSAQIFLQQKDGRFIQKPLITNADINTKRWEDEGMILFDADGDGDLDLYIASGGYENERNTPIYQDKLYVNDGKGNYTINTKAIPQEFTSKMCVRSFDYDKDGDLDLLVTGRVDPWNYPKPVSSFLFRNDSKDTTIRFTDVTASVAPALQTIGLVCDALCSDFDGDGFIDLILAGEWMAPTLLQNKQGKFTPVNTPKTIADQKGWWNSIVSGDFDKDGDIDYVLGNMGKNSFYRADAEHPVSILGGDFDKNGSYDAIPSLYLPDLRGNKKDFPAQSRDDLVKQMISMRNRFQNYKGYAVAGIEEVLSNEQKKMAIRLKATQFASVWMKNNGNGNFEVIPLPKEAQFSTINGMVVDDFNEDGNLDIAINGNDYGTEVSVGRYDAMNGLILVGDGKGGFSPMTILQSGIYIPGNGKALVQIALANHRSCIAASENRGPLRLFELKEKRTNIPLLSNETSATIYWKDGSSSKTEFYYGSSFQSQSGRHISLNGKVNKIIIKQANGASRTVSNF